MIPESIPLKAVMFGDGAKGYALQIHGNDEYGVTVVATRKTRNDVFVQKWSAKCLPGKEFATWPELRAAMLKAKK